MSDRILTGRGIGIAFLDTGVFPHIDFNNRITSFYDCIHHRIGVYDDNGHGTHVAGIAASSGLACKQAFVGVAPKCNIISLKVLDNQGNGKIDYVLRALEWITKNRYRYNIRIINISIGTVEEHVGNIKRLMDAIDKAWADGFVIVTAAGNLGPNPGTITAPGSNRKVITVGCCDMFDQKSASSGCGPTKECICKPDLVYYGKNIISCANNSSSYPYTKKSGTSMATPYVSGAIARLLEKDPLLSNLEVKMLIKTSCDDLGYARNQQGWGKLNLNKFLEE